MNTEKNMEKYNIYRSMHDNLSKAMKAGFYYQAIFIEYAILEDRLTSVLKYSQVPYLNRNGREINISDKIKRILEAEELSASFVKKRLSEELMQMTKEWIARRNDLIHHLANIPYDNEAVKLVAEDGAELCRQIKNKTDSVNNYLKKR
jgi:hypothetical protein